MGLEVSPSWIDDLVATDPVVGDPVGEGDDHLRNIKAVLKSQFSGLGTSAVTVTAAQINDVPNKLISFAGRTTAAAVPTASDYDADQVDYDPTGRQYTAATEVQTAVDNLDTALVVEDGRWYDIAGVAAAPNAKCGYFTTEAVNNITLATVTNDATDGWTMTAGAKDLLVTATLNTQDGFSGDVSLNVGAVKSSNVNAQTKASFRAVATTTSDCMACSFILLASEELSFIRNATATDDGYLNVTIRAIE